MGCRRQGGRRHRFAIACWALGAVAVGLLSGCQQLSDLLGITDPWAGYKNSSDNFIKPIGFDKQNLAATDEGLASTWASWTWAWMASIAPDATSSPYMSLSDVGPVSSPEGTNVTVPAGLDPTAHAYLLDITNLLPKKDSDFEGLSTPSPDWALDPEIGTPSSNSSLQISKPPSVIAGGSSLLLNLNYRIGAKLSLFSLSDSGTATGQHAYRFLLKSQSADPNVPTNLQYAFGSLSSTLFGLTVLPQNISNTLDETTDFSTGAQANTALFLGNTSSSIQNVLVDDIRVIRYDLASSYRLRLLLRPTDTTPALAQGIWSFVVWVLVPPGRKQIADPSAAGPYAASTVTLSMDQVLPSAGFAEEFSIPSTTTSTWLRLELRMSGSNYQFDTNSTTPVIELGVMPTQRSYPDAGGILIAQPELHFWYNGY